MKQDGSVPVKYGIRLNPDDKYRVLKKQLSNLSGLDTSQLLLVEVHAALIKVSQLVTAHWSSCHIHYVYDSTRLGMSAFKDRILYFRHIRVSRLTTRK